MQVDAEVEGGHIEVVTVPSRRRGTAAAEVTLRIPPDAPEGRFRQWFCFGVRRAPLHRPLTFRLVNAGDCTWKDGFAPPYRVHATYGDGSWFRLPTDFAGASLRFAITPARSTFTVAYHPPYPALRLARLLDAVCGEDGLAQAELGRTAEGRPLTLVSSELAPTSAPALWLIAQQHPGEHMAAWFVEGLLGGLTTPAGRALRQRARIYLVPRMNPDGCARGNHRTNGLGLDLNRQWDRATGSPVEVALVRDAMRARGVDAFLDVHGEERLPYVFAQPADDHAGRPARLRALEVRFEAAMLRRAPDFQTRHRYSHVRPEKPFLAVAATWVQHAFGCLALTLEMPFSDNALAPREEGWSPDRSRRLGAQTLLALGDVAGHLRAID